MAGWVVGRLVSGLGVATRDALLPLGRQACAEQGACSALLSASHTWRQWAAPGDGLGCQAQAALLSTSAAPGNAAAAAAAAADAGAQAAAPSGPAAAGDAASSSAASASSSSGESSSASGSGEAGDAAPPTPTLPDPKPELVELLLSTEASGNVPLQRKAARAAVLRDFQRHPADTGSPQVMVAMWTHKVRELVPHFDSNKKRLHAMRQLELLANRRQRMLTWLRRTDFEAYSYTIAKLGLNDVYTHVGHSDRYREGLRPEDQVADDSVNRQRFNYHSKYKQKKSSLWAQLRPRLIAEDPSLGAADVASAAADKQRQQAQRISAARQQV